MGTFLGVWPETYKRKFICSSFLTVHDLVGMPMVPRTVNNKGQVVSYAPYVLRVGHHKAATAYYVNKKKSSQQWNEDIATYIKSLVNGQKPWSEIMGETIKLDLKDEKGFFSTFYTFNKSKQWGWGPQGEKGDESLYAQLSMESVQGFWTRYEEGVFKT